MSQILICDNCGAKIEIEDSDESLPAAESPAFEEDNPKQITLCELCTKATHSE